MQDDEIQPEDETQDMDFSMSDLGFAQYYGQFESQQTYDHSFTGMLFGDTQHSQVFGPGAERSARGSAR